MQNKGDIKSMAKWQEEFRIHDAQGYNSLLQRAELYPMLSRTYGDLLSRRKMPSDSDSLLFAHELLHRWFNQPSRVKGWTEEEIVDKHDEIAEALRAASIVTPDVSVMDAVLHAKSKGRAAEHDIPVESELHAKSSNKTVERDIPVESELTPGCQKKTSVQKAKTEAHEIPVEGELKPDREIPPDVSKRCQKCNQQKCECDAGISLKSNKVLNQTVGEKSIDQDRSSASQDMKPCSSGDQSDKSKQESDAPKLEAVSLSDAETRRAGYQDGIAKGQGAVKAQGQDANVGAVLPVKGAGYREGYQKGYKEAEKNREPNYVDEQISKGGVKMAVENTEPVVLEKAKDEAKKSGAVKDFGARKEQGEAKAPVSYTDKDAVQAPKAEEKKVETNSTHEYDAKSGEAKPEVKYDKLEKDGTAYGMLKCPKCNQGNIMADSPKCPKCGAAHSEMIPIKEEERMGDFPYQKNHSAFDAPPMEAKTPGVPTPAAQKSKLSADDESVTKLMAENQSELRLVKEHLGKITVQFEAERSNWYAERRELIGANQGLAEKLSKTEDELGTVKLDLNTKSSMYKTLLEEHQGLMKRLDEHARAEKREIVDEIVNSNIRMGLLAETEHDAEIQRYLEKPIETLRVLHEEVTKNTKRIADMMLSKKFGVPVEGKQETTEKGKVAKGTAVESVDEAKAKAKKADEFVAQDEMPVEDAEAAGKVLSGATKDSNTIFAQVCRSLKNNRRNK